MFSDLFDELQRADVQPKEWQESVSLILGTDDNLEQAIDECINAPSGVYGCDIETTGLDNRVFDGRTRDSIVGISIAPTPNKSYYFPIGHLNDEGMNISWRRIGEQFGRLFDKEVKARPVFHNASFDVEFLEFNGFFPLGSDRWAAASKWEDTYILAYLLNSRDKGGRGLKALSKKLLDMEMIELKELFGSGPNGKTVEKDYSTLDPTWPPVVWYAAADSLCTLRIYDILCKQYTEAEEHSNFLYTLEKKCSTSVRWMHRCRVHIDAEAALKYAKMGQREWWESLLEVYQGASKILGRDIEPLYIKLMKGEYKDRHFEPFNPDVLGKGHSTYKVSIDEAREAAHRIKKSTVNTFNDDLVITKQTPSIVEVGVFEQIDFPHTYDVLSAQKLGLLFREMEVPNLEASEKSGQVVTAQDVLNKVIEDAEESFPFMRKIKRFRELAKALSVYLIPMVEDVAEDGTLKPKFDQFAADTGRFSCKTNKKPWKTKDGGCRVPFQGIPATYDKSKPECINSLRKCITARDPKSWIIAIDYAGVELRLITNLSREPKWIREFFRCSDCDNTFPHELDEQGLPRPTPPICPNCGSDRIGDLHSLTATAFYGEAAKETSEWKQLRQNAKGCNFALCYGGTGRAVVRTINCSDEEGQEKYNTFTKTYRTLYGWWQSQHKYAREHGHVKTAFGRVLPMPDINHEDRRIRSKDERKSVNSPIQGTSADITKIAMSLIYSEVRKRGWFDQLKMILTVHDEIVFEIHEDIIGEAIPVICELMSRNNAIKSMGWDLPLLVDVEFGKNWKVPYDLKDLRKGYTVNREGEKVYDELPASLVEIFKQEEPEEVESTEAEESLPNVYRLSELTEGSAISLAEWVAERKRQGGEYSIMYEDRDISMLIK